MRKSFRYADVEIRILAPQGDAYPVEITLNSEQEYGLGSLSATEGHAEGRQSKQLFVPSADPIADGERLFAWLFADDRLRAAWGEIRGSHPWRRVRLRIDPEAPELHTVPWELLRDVDAAPAYGLAVAEATPFSRYLAGKWQPGSPVFKRPLRVLVAIANPTGLDAYGLQPVEVESEIAWLRETAHGLDLDLTFLPQPCTLASIEEALRDGHHVLHFIGHGAFDRDSETAVLFLADAEGGLVEAPGEKVAAMLARRLAAPETHGENKLRLVFLASCQTATRSPADAFRGFAPRLVAAGVPAVVAMQDLVTVETARQLAQTFYRRLLVHGQVDLASNEARSAILTHGFSGAAVPVLFQRLRSGSLLGCRGSITRDPNSFWPFLVENLDRGHCLPFLGPRVEAGLVMDRRSVAGRLAERYGYPLPDSEDLTRVAQFMALTDPELLRQDYLRLLGRSVFGHLGLKPSEEEKERFKNAGLSQTLAELGWAERVLEVQESEIHHLLADFRLPLYLTTNPGSFMIEALARHEGIEARREGPRWDPRPGSPQYVLSPPPSSQRPVVFHLNGFDGDPEQERHLVLSEDDYFTHLVRLARDQNRCLPMNLIEALARHSFLFLGYRLDDWDFRLLLHGLLKPIERSIGRRVNVEVQLEPTEGVNSDAALEYLRRYLERFDIDVYWGTPQEFVAELHERWSAREDW